MEGCGDIAIYIVANDPIVSSVTMENCDDGCLNIIGDRTVVRNSRAAVSEDDDCFHIEGNDVELVYNRAEGCDGDGFDVEGDNFTVVRNRATANTNGAGFDLHCDDCSSALIAHNFAENIPDDENAFELAVSGATILNNRAEDAAEQAFYLVGSNNTFSRNTARRIGGDSEEDCVVVVGDWNQLSRNFVDTCHADGFDIFGDHNVLTRNYVRNARQSGFQVSEGMGNEFVNNITGTVNQAAYDLDIGAINTRLINNFARGSNRIDLCDEGTGTVEDNPRLQTKRVAPCHLF
jgi:parallel beta-helix repeat protein